jgi:hypothetical protein
MRLKTIIGFPLKILLLAIVSLIVWIIASDVFISVETTPEITSNASQVIVAMFVVMLAFTLSLSIMILRSAWSGWRLALVVFMVFFGIYSFNSQIEAWYFKDALQLPMSLIYGIVATGFIQTLIFSPLAVWLLGKMKKEDAQGTITPIAKTPFAELLIKLGVLAVIVYPALYFLFGYFVLWQEPQARLLYSGSEELLGFFPHFANTFRGDPWLWPWQIFRTFIWIGIAWPIMRMSKGPWWETGIIVGLQFAILMNAVHILPNPYMPAAVRAAHFWETATSNFILGFVIVWFLHRHHTSITDFFSFKQSINKEAAAD